jgi:hypothetical protein
MCLTQTHQSKNKDQPLHIYWDMNARLIKVQLHLLVVVSVVDPDCFHDGF